MKFMLRAASTLVVLLVGWEVASGQEQLAGAPFGLTWGMGRAEIETLGTELVAVEVENAVSGYYEVRNLTKLPDDTESVLIGIHEDLGLQKVIWIGENVEGDSYGTEGKERFAAIENVLTEKYGTPDAGYVFKHVGMELYNEKDEFYQCLAYDGCGAWMAIWTAGPENAPVHILLQIEGLGRGIGYLKALYEGPRWPEVAKRHEKRTTETDKNAF